MAKKTTGKAGAQRAPSKVRRGLGTTGRATAKGALSGARAQRAGKKFKGK